MKSKIKPLSFEDARHVQAAEGWLGLGDFVSAGNELEEITATERGHPAVLSVRYAIYAKAERWDMAAEVAGGLTGVLPDAAGSWIDLAYATRRKSGGGIPEAKRILLVAQVKFPKYYLIPFNLACYCSQLREFKDAEKWLKKAMAIDEKAVQRMAVEDEDLKPLWDSMGGTIWKATKDPLGAIWFCPADYREATAGSPFSLPRHHRLSEYKRQTGRDSYIENHVKKMAHPLGCRHCLIRQPVRS